VVTCAGAPGGKGVVLPENGSDNKWRWSMSGTTN